MRPILPALALAATIALGGCATPTPYVPAASKGDFGYRDQQIASDRWRVRFAANSVTDRETVEDYLMFRAAELTLAQDRNWFVVVSREVEPRTTYHGYADEPYVSPSVHYGHGRHGSGLGVGLGITTVSPSVEYLAIASIRLLDARPADSSMDAYDARDVVKHLRDAIRRRAPA